MPATLISLISDQTIPNLLLIKEFPDVEKHIFITTPEMEAKEKSQHLHYAADLPAERINKLIVEADSLVDIENKLDKAGLNEKDHYIVNLTGGTKLMSIGLYNFFLNSKLNCEMYYIDIRKHTFRQVFPIVKQKEKPFKANLGLREYLTGYGLSINNETQINSLTCDPEMTSLFYIKYLSFSDFDHSLISALRSNRKKKLKLDVTEATMLKKRWGISLSNEGYINKSEIKFLTGEWFEEYVYSWIKSYLNLEINQISTGVSIKRKEVENEFDVLFYYNHTLSVIECKTGLWNSSANRNILGETLYKLDSLRSDFGLRVKPYIFTLAERGDEKYHIREHHQERAELMGVEIIDRSVLTNPEKRAVLMKKIKG